MAKGKVKMEVVNPSAAGIDVGSRSHFVAINQRVEDVREFGVYAQDLRDLVVWLQENEITTVAMESTGTYWQSLYTELQTAGIEVVLANGKFTKNVKGRKTDVQDCSWIQKLHTLGLLSGSFLPDEATEKLRTYCRHRTNLLEAAAKCSLRMQKYLRLLNLRLDVVVKDITGLTGLRIVEAICLGETDAETLASLRHGNCKKSEEEIAKALQSNKREDFLFALQQEYDQYQYLQKQICLCDEAMKKQLDDHIEQDDVKKALFTEPKVHKRINKNAPQNIDVNLVAYQYFDGIDLLAIQGVGHSTVLTLMSEVGPEGLKKFDTAKQFASWLRLCPNKKVSGGKTLSSRIPKGSNHLKVALRQAANAIGNLKDNYLTSFFHRICFRKGRTAAISATARKLAIIIWNMVVKHQPFTPPETYEYLDQKRKRKVRELQKQLAKLDATLAELKGPQSAPVEAF
jgi:transposase